MQSQTAYIFSSFVIPEGAGPGQVRMEFDAENGAILLYSTTQLIASIAVDVGIADDGTPYFECFTTYGNPGDKTNVQMSSGGILFRSSAAAVAYFGNAFIDVLSNPDAANNVRMSLAMGSAELAAGQGYAFLNLESASRNGVLKPRVTLGAAGDALSVGTVVAVNGVMVGQQFDGVTETQMNWTTLPLGAGFASAGILPQCYVGPDGFVHLEGSLVRGAGTPADGTVIAALPAAFRPRREQLQLIAHDIVGTPARIVIRTGGNIEIYNAPNNRPMLDGVTFSSTQTT